MNRIISALRRGTGWLPRSKGKAVILCASDAESIARCREIASELAGRFPRVNMFWSFFGAVAEDVDGILIGRPWSTSWARRLFLARSKARLVVVAGTRDTSAAALAATAEEEGLAVVALDHEPVTIDEMAHRLDAALAAPGPDERRLRGLHGVACRIGAGLGPSLRSFPALRAALGDPGTILCLGNGPSSEDPRLEDVPHDVLFRVNHLWSKRRAFTRPQVVFTGLRSSVSVLGNDPIYLAQSRDDERRLALMRFVTLPRLRTASAEALKVLPDGMTPTNGAVMLAVAVRLEPRRLVIAGMDLFRHPGGAYPGDANTANAYAPLHDADTELDYILSVLDGFSGELVILSDALAREWERHVDRRNREVAVGGA